VKVSLYLDGVDNPRSLVVSVSETDGVEPVCEPERVSDQITCNHVATFCVSAEHYVVLRIVAAGRILYHRARCGDITTGAFDYEATESLLFSGSAEDLETYEAAAGTAFDYTIPAPTDDEEGTGAILKFEYGTYIKTQEPICFTGDFFPYLSPSCFLLNHVGHEPDSNGTPVDT